MEKLNFRKISNEVDENAPRISVKDITDDIKEVLIEAKIDKIYIEKDSERTSIKLSVYDDHYLFITALAVQENKDSEDFIKIINKYSKYLIKGKVAVPDEEFKNFYRLENDNRVLLINAIKEIEDPIHEYKKNYFCGVEISELYDSNLKDSYNFINKNFDYLQNIPLEDIKDIKFSFYHDVVVLFKNKEVFLNGKKHLENIKELIFFDATQIFAISNDLEIISILEKSKQSYYLNNHNQKYKKMYFDHLNLILLGFDKKIKMYIGYLNETVNPDRLVNVDDIGVLDNDEKTVVVIQDNNIYSLFNDQKYENKNIRIVCEGKDESYTIITK